MNRGCVAVETANTVWTLFAADDRTASHSFGAIPLGPGYCGQEVRKKTNAEASQERGFSGTLMTSCPKGFRLSDAGVLFIASRVVVVACASRNLDQLLRRS